MNQLSCQAIRVGARSLAVRHLRVRIEGSRHLPRRGAALIACRHVHHLYDGCLLLSALPRPAHILVALDWVANRRTRQLMEWACHTAGWPIVLRTERLQTPGQRVYCHEEATGYLRRAVRDSMNLLHEGRMLVVFPEAYPNIDPNPTPKLDEDAFLPFRPGFVRLVELAQRDSVIRVPIIPAGLSYRHDRRLQVTLRFGAPLFVERRADRDRVLQAVEERVRLLSAPLSPYSYAANHEESAGSWAR